MTYIGWMRRHRVMTDRPGKLDIFTVTLVNGRVAEVDTIMDYEEVLARAHAFIKERPCQVKVLPMSGPEAMNFLGIKPPEKPAAPDPELRARLVQRLQTIARDSADTDARQDAFDLLTEMGVIQQ